MAHLIDVVVQGASPTTSGQLLSSTAADAAAWSSSVHPSATTATLENSWTDAAGQPSAAYWLDAFGVVHLDGAVDGSASTGATIFTLPVGSRPTGTARFAVSHGSGVLGEVNISSAGAVVCTGTAPALLALHGITFRTW